jgi:hypothetical protein
VYRNGVRIGVATVSTGKPGYETPTGLFTILQKKREHYSNLYDDAPMPFMQRLTWGGIALHAGRIPGYPASHGCVRLPYAFSELLFEVTSHGITVVITDQPGQAPMLADPGLFREPGAAPAVEVLGTPIGAHRLPTPAWAGHEWAPERAPSGAMTVLVSRAPASRCRPAPAPSSCSTAACPARPPTRRAGAGCRCWATRSPTLPAWPAPSWSRRPSPPWSRRPWRRAPPWC